MFIARKRKWKQNPEERRRKARRLASQCLLLAVLKFTTFWLQGCFIGAILGALMSILSAVAPLIGPGLQLATSIVGVVGQASAAGNQQAAAGPVQQQGPGFVNQTPNIQNAANPLGVPAATPGATTPAQAAPTGDTNGANGAAAAGDANDPADPDDENDPKPADDENDPKPADDEEDPKPGDDDNDPKPGDDDPKPAGEEEEEELEKKFSSQVD